MASESVDYELYTTLTVPEGVSAVQLAQQYLLKPNSVYRWGLRRKTPYKEILVALPAVAQGE